MEQKTLLIIDDNPLHNWYKVFQAYKTSIRVEQTAWNLIEVETDPEGARVTIQPSPGIRSITKILHIHHLQDPIFGTSQKFQRAIKPDFMLVRNFVLGIHGIIVIVSYDSKEKIT